MYTVNLILRNNPNPITAVFKAHKNADDVYKKLLLSLDKIVVEDDFELKLVVDMKEVVAISFSEYEKDMDKNMDLQIVQHKAQLKAQSRARSDIGLQMLEKSANPLIKAS